MESEIRNPNVESALHGSSVIIISDGKAEMRFPTSTAIETPAMLFVDSEQILSAGNWPRAKKLLAVATGLFLNFNVTLGSSLPSGASDALARAFNVSSAEQRSLPVAVFLVGFIFGPMIFGPMSELFGRKICLVSSFFIYTLFTLACALAPNWPALLVFRFIVGVGASGPHTVVGGMYADLFPNLLHRGKAIMYLGLTSNVGPLIGPIISGYGSMINWRFGFWIALIMAGANWPFLLLLPETYGPVILLRHAALDTSPEGMVIPLSHSKAKGINIGELVTVVLTRPIRMFAEPIVLFTDLFLLYGYAIFYLYFEGYPVIFKGIYGMNSGESALMFLPVGAGAVIAMFVFLWYDRFLARSKANKKPWAEREEYRRLPLACFGGPLCAISQFWLAWTARSDIHWIVPALSGIPFGMGVDLIFMALTNYLTDAYGIYSASAMASSVFSRNVVAALLLSLAASQMYEQLGIGWACSVLGFMCLAMAMIPFAFIKYGATLRAKSKFCQHLRQQKG